MKLHTKLPLAWLPSMCECRRSQTLYEWPAAGDDWHWHVCNTVLAASEQSQHTSCTTNRLHNKTLPWEYNESWLYISASHRSPVCIAHSWQFSKLQRTTVSLSCTYILHCLTRCNKHQQMLIMERTLTVITQLLTLVKILLITASQWPPNDMTAYKQPVQVRQD